MGADERHTELIAQHEQLIDRLTLHVDDPTLDEGQRELARAWRNQLEAVRERVLAPLSVAFLAQVGRGKSTLIAAATGLHLPISGNPKEWSVLPVGDGRTTLGETEVLFEERDDILLEVTPVPADELRMELRLFAEDLWDAAGKGERRGPAGSSGGAGEEFHGLLRAWLVPAGDKAPRAVLDQLARSAEDLDALEKDLLSRLDLEQRSQSLERLFPGDEAGLTELREALAALMGGELAGAPAPQRVQLHVPMSDLGREVATLIDTRGIDPDLSHPQLLIAGRSDLQKRIEDEDTMLVLCSEFESAPDLVTRGVLEVLGQLRERAHVELDDRSLRIIIVDRREEPADERAQNRHSRARDERVEQCRDRLQRSELKIEYSGDVIQAIDARHDAEALRRIILDMVRETRERRLETWRRSLEGGETAIESLRDREVAAKAQEIDLRLWWAWDAALAEHGDPSPSVDGLAMLADMMESGVLGHGPQLHAAIRRRGRYRQLDFARLGAEVASSTRWAAHLRALGTVLEVIQAASYEADADADKHLEVRYREFISSVVDPYSITIVSWQKVLAEYFQSPRSNDLWRWCEWRWGQGSGYVSDIADRFRKEADYAALQQKVKQGESYLQAAFRAPALRADLLRSPPPSEMYPPRPPLFRLDRVEVRNFRGFPRASIQAASTTVLAGDNGLGKTCWLEAIAAAIGALLPGIGAGPAPALSESDVRQVVRELGGVPDRQHQLPMAIDVAATVQGRPLTWSRRIDTLPGETAVTEDDALQILARQIGEEVRAHSVRQLPVLAYYGTQRLWPPELEVDNGRRDVGSRLDGYRDCLAAASNHRHMMEWMRHFTQAELQDKQPVVQLRAIERAVVSCVEEGEHFRYSLRHEELQLILRDGQVHPFRLLSDGYRNMVAMVADIAWRASVLNPQLGDRAPALAEGVVLIDEIDLHLHPKWQRRVLADLRRAFPGLQFITTTHSPFIIQSLEPGQLVNLDPEAEDVPYADESPEDIAEHIMGVEVPQRSERRRRASEVAEKYYKLLDQVPDADEAELQRLKVELDELLAPYRDNQAFVALLERKRALAEGKRS